MIQTYLQQLFVLVKRLLVCYLAYFLCRLLFFAANRNYFPDAGFAEILSDCFYGLRFDTFSIAVSNSLFILLSAIPAPFVASRLYQKIVQFVFVLTNSIFILANCIDVGYFPFIKRRTGVDLLEQIAGQSDLGRLLPQFVVDFWWVVLAYAGIVFLLVVLYKRIRVAPAFKAPGAKPLTGAILIFLFVLGLTVLAIRGGFQRIPIDIVNAGSVTTPERVPIVLNTPFTLIKTADRQPIQDYTLYSDVQLKALYDPLHYFKDSTFRKPNVMVIILESFSKEYTSLGGGRSITPFLDSLMQHSLVFSNAFSNGTRSIEGIPAILSSLPSLMENSFINSIYANNQQTSFGTLLGKEGYETAFFHGGINGTMNFDNWAALAGYQHYYGKDEYNNNEDFDGYWGIWDEPFLQFTVKKTSTLKEPFHAAVFTLSSHHPYFVPKQYAGKFPKTGLENSESIGYADHALRRFFASASKTSWYRNTLFIVSADHAAISHHRFFSNVIGNLSIPVLFFKPDNSLKGRHSAVFSQVDILPSVMQLMGYNKPFFAFGQSFLSEKKYPSNYFYANGVHYLTQDSMAWHFRYPAVTGAYNYRRDSALTDFILGRYPLLDSLATRNYCAFIQTYNRTLIRNSGALK